MKLDFDMNIPDLGMSPALQESATRLRTLTLLDSDSESRTPWPDLSDAQLHSLADRLCAIAEPSQLHYQVLQMLILLRTHATDGRAVAIWARQANNYIEQLPSLLQSLAVSVAQQVLAQPRSDRNSPN